MISANTKSCLNCVWSGFVIEKEDGLYGYEGDCLFGLVHPTRIWDDPMDDTEELKTAKQLIFEDMANKCKSYKQTGIGKPNKGRDGLTARFFIFLF